MDIDWHLVISIVAALAAITGAYMGTCIVRRNKRLDTPALTVHAAPSKRGSDLFVQFQTHNHGDVSVQIVAWYYVSDGSRVSNSDIVRQFSTDSLPHVISPHHSTNITVSLGLRAFEHVTEIGIIDATSTTWPVANSNDPRRRNCLVCPGLSVTW